MQNQAIFEGEDYMESLSIRVIFILALIVALAALLIMGTLDVTRQLLSKNIFVTPSVFADQPTSRETRRPLCCDQTFDSNGFMV
jgi:hypothetical protein